MGIFVVGIIVGLVITGLIFALINATGVEPTNKKGKRKK